MARSTTEVQYTSPGEVYKVTVRKWVHNGRVVATYHGGAYIDLSFGGWHPSEVINVYDYATGKPEIPFTEAGVLDFSFAATEVVATRWY